MACKIIRTIKFAAIAAAGGLLALSTGAIAADASKEISTAATHAGLAATATVIDTVHVHLHHTVNCLVGPSGAGYDAKQMDPCKGMGGGAIPDTSDAAKKKMLEDALAKANAGLAANDLTAAKKAASDTEAALKGAM